MMPLETYRAHKAALEAIDREQAVKGAQEILPALPPIRSNETTVNLGPPDSAPTLLGKALKVASLAFEPLRRGTQASREAILWMGGKTTTEGLKSRATAALNGKLRMSTSEFGQILVGREKWESMRRTPAIPGWLPAITNPEMGVIRKIKTGQISLADMWSLGAEVWADPFTYLALTPVGVGAKIGGFAAKVPGGTTALKLATFPWTAPTRVVSTVLGNTNRGLVSIFNHIRQPEDVLTGAQRVVFEDFKNGADRWMQSTHDTWAQGKSLFGKRVKLASESDRRIGAKLWGKPVKLTPEETVIYKDLNDFVTTHLDELVRVNPSVLKELGPRTAKLIATRGHLTLDVLFPSMVQRNSIPIDIWQSWSIDNLGKVFLGLSNEQALKKGLAINLVNTPLEKFSAIESVRDLMFVVKKKQYLEPELFKHAPKPGRVGESLATRAAGRTKRRYITDLINAFTGNARGRKQIEHDYMLVEMWEKLAAHPAGARVEKLFTKLGYGMTRDGMPDVSPTTKIAGLWSSSIIQNILGLRMKSALVNSTQTLNFAVSRGLPATIKGLFKLTDPKFKQLRGEANLKGDYRALFDDDVWLRGLGKKWSDALLTPFNAMENIIRGTGFHVGIDQWMRKNARGRTLTQVMGDKVSREEMVRFAHFESLNGAFVYGTLGRPPAIAGNPMLRPFTTLLSFPFKQAEFLRREFVRDPSSILRFIGLHGWLIERSNEWGGVAAEDFLGWGFKPMTKSFGGIPLVTSPPVSLLMHSIEALNAHANSDPTLAKRKWRQAADELPLVLSPVPLPWLAARELAGKEGMGSFLGSKQGLIDQWQSKRKEIGEGFVPISRPEVIKNYLIGRSTTQKLRSDLDNRMRKADRLIDFELDSRALKVAKALTGHSGDDLGDAIGEFVKGMTVEGRSFYPLPEMLESRLKRAVEKKLISRDILAMLEGGFLNSLFLVAQMDLFTRVSKETR